MAEETMIEEKAENKSTLTLSDLKKFVTEVEKDKNYKKFTDYVDSIERFLLEPQWLTKGQQRKIQSGLLYETNEHLPHIDLISWVVETITNKVKSYSYDPKVELPPEQADFARLAEELLKTVFNKSFEDIIETLSYWIILYDCVGCYVYEEDGEFCLQPIHPAQILVDPEARSIDQARFFGFKEKVTGHYLLGFDNPEIKDIKPTDLYDIYHLFVSCAEQAEIDGVTRYVDKYYVFTDNLILSAEEYTTPCFVIASISNKTRTFYRRPSGSTMKNLAQALNSSLKYWLDNAYRAAHNKVAVKEEGISNLDEVYQNKAAGVIKVIGAGPVTDYVYNVSPPPVPEAHKLSIDMILQLTDLLFHVSEHLKAQQLGSDTSGRALIELTSASFFQINRIVKALQNALASCGKWIIETAFEGRFQPKIIIGDTELFPSTPQDRAVIYLAIIQQLQSMPPPIIFTILDAIQLPRKDELKKAFQDYFEQQAEADRQKQLQQLPSLPKPIQDIVKEVVNASSQTMVALVREIVKINPQLAEQYIAQLPDILTAQVTKLLSPQPQPIEQPLQPQPPVVTSFPPNGM
jgi:hypothetical protein